MEKETDRNKENTNDSQETALWNIFSIFIQILAMIAAPKLPEKLVMPFLFFAGILVALAIVFAAMKKTHAVMIIAVIGFAMFFISCLAPLVMDEADPAEPSISVSETIPEESTIASEEAPPAEDSNQTEPTAAPTTQPTETEIDFQIYLYSCNGIYIQLTAEGETGNQDVHWYSSDSNIATVDASGLVTAHASGQVVITAEVYSGGKSYTEEKIVTVQENSTITGTGRIRYFESVPEGIDRSHQDYLALTGNNQIFESESAALSRHNIAGHAYQKTTPKVIGYVFYHWCRGDGAQVGDTSEDDYPYDEGSYHNRLSESQRCEKTVNGALVQFDTFSCFFSDRYLSESEMLFATDASGCVWYSGSGACYDSYWFWPAPIYEYEFEVVETELIASVD